MHGVGILQDLAVVLLVAGAVTVLCHRLRQPVVLGYLLAGLIIGPHTPPFALVHDRAAIEAMAELGMILLLFGLGLHFSLRQLARVGVAAVTAAAAEIALMIWIGYQLGRWFGWSMMDSVFLGALLSVSSTTIIVKAFEELGLAREGFARLVFGILIVEDILSIALIALLSGFSGGGGLALGEVARTLGLLGLFLTGVLVVGLLMVPRLVAWVARFRSDEVLLITVLGLCFGTALLAAKVGYSVALGAFLAGAIMAESPVAARVRSLVEPVRDVFSAVFFVAIGLLIDPALLAEHAVAIGVIVLAVVIGKLISCSLGSFIAGTPLPDAMRTGASLSQIGEFSFIIAQLGVTLGVTSGFLYPVAVSVSAVTTLLTPYLIRFSPMLVRGLERLPAPLRGALDAYSAWAAGLGTGGDRPGVRRVVRSCLLQIALDLALVATVMVGAARLAAIDWSEPSWLPSWSGGRATLWWFAAMLVALPLLVHLWYKQRALAMILGELAVPRSSTGARADLRRRFAVVVYQAVALGAVGVLLTALSLAVLPPWPVLLLLGALLITLVVVGWRRLVTLYAGAQVSLIGTFAAAEAADAAHAPARDPAPPLEDAVTLPVELDEGWRAVGSSIAALNLRSVSGAMVIALERNGRRLLNPDPGEPLQAGDRLTLFGDEAQVRAARRLLNG